MAKSKGQAAHARTLGISRQRVYAQVKAGKLRLRKSGQGQQAQWQAERIAAQTRSPERRVKDFYEAKRAKIEFEQLVGTLVERSAVSQEWFRLARQVRDGILNIPDRLAGVLVSTVRATADDLAAQHTVHASLTTELRQALEALADEPRPR